MSLLQLYSNTKRLPSFEGEETRENTDIRSKVDHVVYTPNGETLSPPSDFNSDYNKEMFEFDLDLFQIESIKAINTGSNVITIASTSAGKSVVAFHAIHRSNMDGHMAIYTAPVKSLANQKYYELKMKFNSVGIITGDVSVDSKADVIVMTAEVLRNHLMANSSLLSSVKHIILDEAHYIGDPQRGCVWEEIIVSAPSQVRFVLLSATIPNGNEISKWLSTVTNINTHTITQYFRPVPLNINVFSESSGIVRVKSGDNPPNNLLISEICKSNGILGAPSTRFTLPKDPPYYLIANYANEVVKNGTYPLILFCLSRARCVQISKIIKGEQSNEALDLFDAAAEGFDASIRSSEQFVMVRDLISKGVGIHHSGIITVLRETIEQFFSNGLLKVLVATETFALGVNSPARAVMLSSLVKWGGESFRAVSSSEFLQMAGRAGRRGCDNEGDVFIYVSAGTSPEFISNVINKKSERLISRMRVTPSLILSCVSSNRDTKKFIDLSLLRYQGNLRLEELRAQPLPEISDQEKNLYNYEQLINQVTQICLHQNNIKNVLQKGRLIFISLNGVVWGWSSVITYDSRNKNIEAIVSALKDKDGTYIPCNNVKIATLLDVTFPLNAIKMISSIKIENPITDIGMSRASSLLGVLDRIYKQYKNQVPLFTGNSLTYGKEKVIQLNKQMDSIKKKLTEAEIMSVYNGKSPVESIIAIKSEIKSLENPKENDDIQKITKSLISLNYISKDGLLLELKGRVARSIKLEDPVPLTELLFSGFFVGMDKHMICVCSSCFVESPPKFRASMTASLTETWTRLKKSLSKIDQLGIFSKPHKKLMGFTHAFLAAGSISDAVKDTPGISEGMATRIAKRMQQIIQMLVEASRLVGSTDLSASFDDAMELIISVTKLDDSIYKTD